MGIAATAGCSGILDGGGCSISADSASDLLPEEGNGFSEEQTSEFSQGENVEEGAFGRYSDDDGKMYDVSILKFESADAAQEEAGEADFEGTALLVRDGEWFVLVVGPEDVDEGTVRDLLGQTSLSSGCVSSAQPPEDA